MAMARKRCQTYPRSERYDQCTLGRRVVVRAKRLGQWCQSFSGPNQLYLQTCLVYHPVGKGNKLFLRKTHFAVEFRYLCENAIQRFSGWIKLVCNSSLDFTVGLGRDEAKQSNRLGVIAILNTFCRERQRLLCHFREHL